MRIYLAGPMTGIPHHNVPAFDAVAAHLRARGHEVVSPPDITRANPQPGIHRDGSIDPTSYCALVRLDLAGLLDCDAMLVLPGWSWSKGCRLEIAVACSLSMPIYLASDVEMKHPMRIAGIVTLLGPALNDDKASALSSAVSAREPAEIESAIDAQSAAVTP